MNIIPVEDVDLRLVGGRWDMPDDMRKRAAEHWAAAVARNPHIWDGRILGMTAPGRPGGLEVTNGILRSEAREDAYSVFMAWRDWGFPEIGIRNLFGSALILSSDNALIFGVMGGRTANAGQVYPPAGSLEPRDVSADGSIDVLGSVATELHEETGLFARDAQRENLLAVLEGPRISLGCVLRFDEPAERLAARIRANLAAQEHRELADVVVVRSSADVAAAGPHPPYAAAVAAHVLGR